MSKAQSDIGANPFQLLCEIARARAEGITSATLAKVTKQDARSLTGRLNLLIKLGLIKKYSIISNGSWTYVSVFHKFVWAQRDPISKTKGSKPKKNGSSSSSTEKAHAVLLDKTLIRRKVMEALKVAPRNILFYLDMVEELNVRRGRLGSILRKLAKEGYVEQLVMFREDAPHRCYLCVRFLKDLPASDDPDEQDDDDDDDEDAEEAEDENPGMDDPESSKTMGIINEKELRPNDLEKMQEAKAEEMAADKRQSSVQHKVNFVYSFTSQVFQIIKNYNAAGIPGGVILQELTGRSFARVVNKELEGLTGTLTSDQLKKYIESPLGHLLVIRGVDFSARIKYYRYFTNTGYVKFNNEPEKEIWGSFFFSEKPAFQSLAEMEKGRSIPLPGRANVVSESNGNARLVFYGEISKLRKDGFDIPIPESTPTTGGKKRGRPRKNPIVETPSKKSKKNEPEASIALRTISPTTASVTQPDLISQEETQQSDIQSSLVVQAQSIPAENVPSNEIPRVAEPETVVDPSIHEAQAAQKTREAEETRIAEEVQENRVAQESLDSQDIQDDHISENNQEGQNSEKTQESQKAQNLPSVDSEDRQDKKMVGLVDEDLTHNSIMKIISQHSQTPVKRGRNFVRQRTQAVSLGDQKRIKQLLEALELNNGVAENGTAFLIEFNNRFKEENGSSMDRKTYEKMIKLMEENETIRVFKFTLPCKNKDGSKFLSKSLVVANGISDDDNRIKEVKERIAQNLEVLRNRAAPHSVARKSASGNFFVMSEKYKTAIRRSNLRYLSINGLLPKSKTRRLRKADTDREKTRKGRKKRKHSGDDSLKEGETEDSIRKRRRIRGDGSNNTKKRRSRKSRGSDEEETGNPDIDIGVRISDTKKVRRRRKAQSFIGGDDPILLRETTVSHRLFKNARKYASKMRLKTAEGEAEKNKNKPARKKERGHRAAIRNITNLDTFVRVVIICRSFSEAGLIKMDWEHIAKELRNWYPDVSASQARSLWARSRVKIGGSTQIYQLINVWMVLFERGYESGEIKLMDPEDLDIPYLVAYWRLKSPFLKDPDGSPALFEDRKKFEEEYIIIPGTYVKEYDTVLNHKSMVQVNSKLADWCMAAPRTEMPQIEEKIKEEDTEIGRAKTSIKALIGTPERLYDTEVARDMLLEYSDETINGAVKSLDDERSIVYVPRDFEKVQPGRNFMFSDRFMSTITLWVDPNILMTASRFFDNVKTALSGNNGYIVSRAIPDSNMMCLVDLIASLQVDLVPVKMQNEEIGKDDENANPDKNKLIGKRYFDRSKHDCDIVVRTPVLDKKNDDELVKNTSEPVAQGVLGTVPPLGHVVRPHTPLPMGNRGEYIWVGVKGLMSGPIFERLIVWILIFINGRPGITAELLCGRLRPVLTLKEVNVLLEWLYKQRILEKTRCDGYRLLPGWYYNVFN